MKRILSLIPYIVSRLVAILYIVLLKKLKIVPEMYLSL